MRLDTLSPNDTGNSDIYICVCVCVSTQADTGLFNFCTILPYKG